MYHVYILKSQVADKIYIGETGDEPTQRLAEHNAGSSSYSRRYKPWVLTSFITVKTKPQAIALETYLKTGAGRAFISKYLNPHQPEN